MLGGEDRVSGEQVCLAGGAADEAADAAGGVSGRGDHFDAVGVDTAGGQFDIDGRVPGDGGRLGRGRVKTGNGESVRVWNRSGRMRVSVVVMGSVSGLNQSSGQGRKIYRVGLTP